MPNKQLKMLLGWTAIHQEELEGVFALLKDKDRFQSAFIDEFGNVAWDIDDSIDSSKHWENRIDICKDALYMDSIPAH